MTVPMFPAQVRGLDDDEQSALQALSSKLAGQRGQLEVFSRYYDGMQRVQDLGISIPPALQRLRTVPGWVQVAIDALAERCVVEGFRYPGATDTDDDLWAIWQGSDLDGESPLAHLDSLIFGRSYLTAAYDPTIAELPRVAAESPMNMTARWDGRLRRVIGALQFYQDRTVGSDMFGQALTALYLPDRTVYLARRDGDGSWELVDRVMHGLGRVPVVPMANRQRLTNRDGSSEITPSWMNTYDSACRTLLGMEVAREFFAAPRRYVLGAAEDAFVKANGQQIPAWDAYLSKVWTLERDEEGNIPTVGQFASGDPSAFTQVLDAYAKIMSGLSGLPAHYFGLNPDANPTSAEAIRAQEARLIARVKSRRVAFGEAWEEALRIALQMRGGEQPPGAERIETDWMDPATPTIGATSDAIAKQIQVGAIPAHSDVTLKKLGYSSVERERLEQDRQADEAQQFLAELASSLEAREARADTSIAHDMTTGNGRGSGTAAPAAGQ